MKYGEKLRVNPFVMLREEFDDWAVLFNPDTGHGFGLNPTGVYLWKLLDGEHTLDALLAKLRVHADNVPEDAKDHIEAFVDALVAQGLAGSDSTESGPEKLSSSPGEVTEVGPFTYKPPKLVDLSGEAQAAHGLCQDGTEGRSQGGCHQGSNNGGDCWAGILAGYGCTIGNNQGKFSCTLGCSNAGGCANGTSPGSASCCYTGIGIGE